MPNPTVDPKLPPAGHKRDEELKKRTDTLEEAAATKFENMGATNPDAFDVDREIAGHFDELTVTAADPGYHYCWVNADNYHGRQVKDKLARRGWQVVTGDMVEARECKTAEGTRRIGDVILLRIKKEYYKLYQEAEEKKRKDFEQTHTTGGLEELNRQLLKKTGKQLIYMNPDEMPEHIRKSVMSPGENEINGMRAVRGAQAQHDTALRNGTIAGLKP